ncbi:MAG: protein kinase, partial [Verrucomicrobia bacterium]|nr:protein kinase [Verrucomicrobiota bacterium]
DFGLVKALHLGTAGGVGSNAVVGTPHFMSPEAVERPESVGLRSDLYSLGAVGYWLLTGKTLFDQDTVEGLLVRQVKELPRSPSERLGQPVSADLAELIMQCLEKSPEQRPPSAEALDYALARCASAGTWTSLEAEHWWSANLAAVETSPVAKMAEKTLVIAPRP